MYKLIFKAYTHTSLSSCSIFGLGADPRRPLTTSRIKLFCNRFRYLCMLTTNAYVLVMSGGRQHKFSGAPQLLVRNLSKHNTHNATICMWASCKSMPMSFSISSLCVSECLSGQALEKHAPTVSWNSPTVPVETSYPHNLYSGCE